jgi:EmrB/QacA subfamily drug resistance transporter
MSASPTASSADLSPGPSESARALLPWLVAVAFFMESLDTTILNTAVPAVAEALHVAPLSMKAVLASYTLSLAVFIPISGWMADRFGTRRVFSSAIGIFTFGSFLCGVCSNIHLLVACRVLQGVGGAMMVPVGRLTLVRSFPKSELIRMLSFVTIPALMAPMLGPVAGGLIVAYFHWRVIFFLNIPIGLIGLVLVYIHLPDFREESTPPLDVVGLILFGSGVALLSYVLEVFGDHQLGPGEIAGMLVISFVLLVGYWLHARTLPAPLLQLKLFGNRVFRSAVNGNFFTRLGIGGIPFLLPLLYQTGLGFTPIQSGLLIMPQAIASMFMKTMMRRLIGAIGFRGILVSNTVIMGGLLALFVTIGAHTPLWYIILLSFIYGAIGSLQYTSMNTLVYADIEERDTSNASSIASTVQQMSMSFGVTIAGIATSLFVPDSATFRPEQMIHGIHKAFLLLGALTIASTAVFASLKRGDGSAAVSPEETLHHSG